jgi:transposase-like protein
MMLDFEIGSSENQEVCESLLNRLVRHGFEDPKERRLLVVLDGSVPLRKGVSRRFDNPVLQRCQIHKQRNIRGVLSKKHHSELAEMFKLLRSKSGAERAREVLGEIDAFLSQKSSKAIKSLREAGEDLISLQTLGCPKELHSTLLNTNAIENSINNIRRKTRRVKRWRAETDQAERWTT